MLAERTLNSRKTDTEINLQVGEKVFIYCYMAVASLKK